MPDVFISYSSKDLELAKGLVKNLEARGISVWFDDNALLVGQDVVDEVYEGIRNSRYLAIVLTENSVNSKWVKQELNFAYERRAMNFIKKILMTSTSALMRTNISFAYRLSTDHPKRLA